MHLGSLRSVSVRISNHPDQLLDLSSNFINAFDVVEAFFDILCLFEFELAFVSDAKLVVILVLLHLGPEVIAEGREDADAKEHVKDLDVEAAGVGSRPLVHVLTRFTMVGHRTTLLDMILGIFILTLHLLETRGGSTKIKTGLVLLMFPVQANHRQVHLMLVQFAEESLSVFTRVIMFKACLVVVQHFSLVS